MIGPACLGGGAGRIDLRAATMTASLLLTKNTMTTLFLYPPIVALPVYQAGAVDASTSATTPPAGEDKPRPYYAYEAPCQARQPAVDRLMTLDHR